MLKTFKKRVHDGEEASDQSLCKKFKGESEKLHILIVDDSNFFRMVLKKIFEDMHCQCSFAEDGNKAIEIFKDAEQREEGIGIIFMDIVMPNVDGYTATRGIRDLQEKNEISRKIPIIGLSTNNQKDDIRAAYDAGMNDFLGKPFKREELVRIYYKWVKCIEEDLQETESKKPITAKLM